MSELTSVCAALLYIYRERNGSPEFWAEPFNALTNAAFLIAAGFALYLAVRRQAATPMTVTLISLAAAIGVGSFMFHTVPSRLNMWLDIGPIAAFQVVFLWLACRRMLEYSGRLSASIVVIVMGSSFALMPFHEAVNGSLFYAPCLVAMIVLGGLWAERSQVERYLLLIAAGCFGLAIVARSIDWIVPWSFGSHFIWHLLNGCVVYLALRSWIVNDQRRKSDERHIVIDAEDTPITENVLNSCPASR